jgi:hypothetical protein
LDVVVIGLGLGTNDLKTQFSNSAHSIAAGVRILARDVQRATAIGRAWGDQHGERLDGHTPEIIILGPPRIKETEASIQWGFVGAEKMSQDLVPLLTDVALSVDGFFVDLQQVAEVSDVDGVHFDVESQEAIATAVSAAVGRALDYRAARRL